jgi:hypothetical protein
MKVPFLPGNPTMRPAKTLELRPSTADHLQHPLGGSGKRPAKGQVDRGALEHPTPTPPIFIRTPHPTSDRPPARIFTYGPKMNELLSVCAGQNPRLKTGVLGMGLPQTLDRPILKSQGREIAD